MRQANEAAPSAFMPAKRYGLWILKLFSYSRILGGVHEAASSVEPCRSSAMGSGPRDCFSSLILQSYSVDFVIST